MLQYFCRAIKLKFMARCDYRFATDEEILLIRRAMDQYGPAILAQRAGLHPVTVASITVRHRKSHPNTLTALLTAANAIEREKHELAGKNPNHSRD